MTDGNHFTGPGEHIPDRKMADMVRYASVAIAIGFDPDKPDFINVSRMERPDNEIPMHYEIKQLREIIDALEARLRQTGEDSAVPGNPVTVDLHAMNLADIAFINAPARSMSQRMRNAVWAYLWAMENRIDGQFGTIYPSSSETLAVLNARGDV
jgi:hypothetical protein